MTSSHPLICCIGVLHTVVLAGVRNADMQQNFLGTRVIEQSFGHPSRTGARSRLTRPRLPKCPASRLGNLIRWEHHEAPEPGMVLPPAMEALYVADDHGLKIAAHPRTALIADRGRPADGSQRESRPIVCRSYQGIPVSARAHPLQRDGAVPGRHQTTLTRAQITAGANQSRPDQAAPPAPRRCAVSPFPPWSSRAR